MKGYDTWPIDQSVPAGFRKLAAVRDQVGAVETIRRLQSAELFSSEYLPEDGSIKLVDSAEWRSEFAHEMLSTGYKRHYFSPDMPHDPGDAREVFSYGSRWRLLLVADTQPVVEKPAFDVHKNKGGRPRKWDWTAATDHLAAYINENDDTVQNTPVLIRVVREYFGNLNNGDHPAESSIRDRVSKFHRTVYSKT